MKYEIQVNGGKGGKRTSRRRRKGHEGTENRQECYLCLAVRELRSLCKGEGRGEREKTSKGKGRKGEGRATETKGWEGRRRKVLGNRLLLVLKDKASCLRSKERGRR